MVDIAAFPDEKIVALTLWGEIRGGSSAQKLNVANVIRNRVRAQLRSDGRPDWWGEGWRDVCLARAQFSCWFDAQRDRMLALPETDRQYQACLGIARRVMAGRDPDPTNGATHYHTVVRPEGVTRWPPNWGDVLQHETLRDGLHIFYRDPRARYPEDAVAAVRATSPQSMTGPLVTGTGGAGTATDGLSALDTSALTQALDQAERAQGIASRLWDFVAANPSALFRIAIGLIVIGCAIAWAYRRFQTWRATA